MLEKTTVGKSSELMAMDISTDLRLRAAVIPPLAQTEGSPDRASMEGVYLMARLFPLSSSGSLCSPA
jgi:hypothetical protein